LCFGEPIAILDGNVKRVLTRCLGFKEDLASSRVEKELWAIAQTLLPQRDVKRAMPRYTQGVMDLGATVCTPKKPQCVQCPLADTCVAKVQGQPEAYPLKTRKLKRTSEQLWLLHAVTHSGEVWLTQRPQTGVWAGLYCLPLFESFDAVLAAVPAKYHPQLQEGAAFKHVLTHKDLHLHPVQLSLPRSVKLGTAVDVGQWVAKADWPVLGLPAPIRKLLER
jgi:A/G-specific adenine glycosylase